MHFNAEKKCQGLNGLMMHKKLNMKCYSNEADVQLSEIFCEFLNEALSANHHAKP